MLGSPEAPGLVIVAAPKLWHPIKTFCGLNAPDCPWRSSTKTSACVGAGPRNRTLVEGCDGPDHLRRVRRGPPSGSGDKDTLQMACARASRAGAPTVLGHPGLGRGLGVAARSPWPASVLGSLDLWALLELAAFRVLHGRPGVPPRARRRACPYPARNRRGRPVHHQPAPGAQLRTHRCPGVPPIPVSTLWLRSRRSTVRPA